VVVDLIRVNGNPQSPKVTAPAVLIAGPYVDSIKNARNNIKDDVKRSGQNYEIEDIYPSLKRENLWNVVNRAKFQNEPGIYLIRGPPDSFYVIRNYGYGMIQVIKIESEYKPISREKREEFENIIKKSGRTSITRGGYSFKCVQESFDHALGNGLIMLENLAIYNAFQPGNSALDEKDISALLEDMAKFVNSQTENLGFETVFYAYTVNTDNINGGASELMPVTEKMWEAKKTANKSGAKVLTFDYYNKNEKLINMEIGAMRIAAKAAAEKLLTEENDVLARSLKMFTDSIKKVEPTKAVIGDLARAKTDIVVIRGSGTYYSKQKSEEREISAKLHKDYGLETLPYSYKFGEGWFEDLTGEKGAERKSVLGRAVEILNDRMRNNEDDPRMIIFVPSESVDKVKEIIGQRYATVKDRISVIGELDSTPANGATDTVMHIVLGKGLLNYQRYQEKLEPEAKDRLVDLIKALVTNPEDITPAIMDELLKGIKYLRIKPVDFKDIEDWKKSQDDVLRAL